MDSAPQAYAADAGGTAAEAAGTSDLSDAVQNSADLLPQDGRKIILNATLSIEALDFNATCTALARAAQSCGGYVSSTSIDTPAYEGAYRTAYYQFRIPAEQYSVFLDGAGSAGNLVSKQESTQDVTSAYVDVEARLKSLKLQEERLYAMMEQAGDLETLLAIQNQLTEVQYQIESYTAQQRTYDDLISYSTVDVTVEEVKQITEKSRDVRRPRIRRLPPQLARLRLRCTGLCRGLCRCAAHAAGVGRTGRSGRDGRTRGRPPS